ncbi:MAG TPA: phosphoribosylglycinamide formyltransferase [Trueperaceae bacterium]
MGFPLGRPARLAVIASGRGSNLASLLASFPPGGPEAEVVLVAGEKERAPALARAREAGVEAVHVPWDTREGFEARLDELLGDRGVDLACLAGFMRVLSPWFVGRWHGRLLNVHPSLLPKHRGLHAHRQALAEGVSESGCSVHFVDAGVDTGKVIVQRRVPVLPGDTEETLAERVLREEHVAYPEAVRLVLRGEVRP